MDYLERRLEALEKLRAAEPTNMEYRARIGEVQEMIDDNATLADVEERLKVLKLFGNQHADDRLLWSRIGELTEAAEALLEE